MTTAAVVLKSETVVLLPVDQCHKSPTQPRRRGGGKLDPDFIASIKEKGVLQPIIARDRKAGGGWEIVFGHRRHEGSMLAELETIPAIIRVMTDEEVFEAQLIENIHRADMHPLDEADGFKRMIEHGRTIPEIAAKIGRPPTYVAQRLKLCELGKEARAALDKEEISLGVAVLIARVPASLQAEAVEMLDTYGDRLISVAEAKKELEAEYLLRLDHAPFDIASATLVPKAGACTACPKRTGQQRELFPDAARADLCTDRICYRGKLDALWQIKKKEAAKGGPPVIDGHEAQKALTAYSGPYRKLDDEQWVDGNGNAGGGHKKIRTILGKNLPPITLARDDKTGDVFELVKRTDVDKILKKIAPASRSSSGDDSRKREEAKQRRRAAAVSQAMAEAVERAPKLPAAELLHLLVHALVQRSWNDVQQAVLRRRGLEAGAGAEGKLLAHLRKLTKPEEVAGLGIELALRAVAPASYTPGGALWGSTLKTLGIDYAAIERKIAADAKAKKKTGKKKAA